MVTPARLLLGALAVTVCLEIDASTTPSPLACSADPNCVELELGLGIDESSSIDSAEYALQKQAYRTVLSDPDVIPQDGSVAVGMWGFAGRVQTIFEPMPWTPENMAVWQAQLDAYVRLNGSTGTGPAIQQISNALMTNSIVSFKQVIDISTDGVANVGLDPAVAADNAVANGIDQINCLAIELPASGICGSYLRGTDAFAKQAATFSDFENALREKLVRETQTCTNGGFLSNTGACVCSGSWTGPTCQNCTLNCVNGGTLDRSKCTCSCPRPFAGTDCSTGCENVWSQYQYEPEEWSQLPRLAAADPNVTVPSSLNLGQAYGGRNAELSLSGDGQNLYVSGGYNDPAYPFLNVHRRYLDGTLKLLQQLGNTALGFTASDIISIGRLVCSSTTSVKGGGSDNVYALVFQHNPGPHPSAHLVALSRSAGSPSFGRLSFLSRYPLVDVLTTETLPTHAGDVHIAVSPDGDSVFVGAQGDATDSFLPIIHVFRRTWSVLSSANACNQEVDRSTGKVFVDLIVAPTQCGADLSCVQSTCTQRTTDGSLTYVQKYTSGLQARRVTSLFVDSESEFVYMTASGYWSGAPFYSDTLHVLTRATSSDLSLSLVQKVTDETYGPASASVQTSYRAFLSPDERFIYTVTDRQGEIAANRTIAVRTRSHLDGRAATIPLLLQDLGPCAYDTRLHPAAICTTSKYVFLQSRLAAEGTMLAGASLTTTEVYGWSRDECPVNVSRVSTLLRSTYNLEDADGYYNVHGIACDDDYAYVRTNNSLVLFHTAPRDLQYVVTDPVQRFVFRKDSRIPLTKPRYKGGTIQSFEIIGSPLPSGLVFNRTSGTLSGTPVEYFGPSDITIRGYNRRAQYTDLVINVAVIYGSGYRCPSDIPVNASNVDVKEGFDFSVNDPWWWLWLLLLLLLLLLCCIASWLRYRRKKRQKEFMPEAAIVHVHHHHHPESESDSEPPTPPPAEVMLAPIVLKEKKPDPKASQLRLKPTADRGIFMFGTRRVQMSIINNKLMVRIGGGWMGGQEFVQKNAPIEARKMGLSEDEEIDLLRIGDDLGAAESVLRDNKPKKPPRGKH